MSFAVGPKYAKMDLHQVNEYPWLTIPSRYVNTTTALVLLDDVFDSPVDDEDIEKQEHSFFICTIPVPYQCYN